MATVPQLWQRIRHHSLGRNAIALTAMQATNYIAPLMVIPYLTRVLGTHEFGAVAVTLAAIQFAFVVTDYGFSLSATRDIALNSTDKHYVSRKIGAVWGAKLPLLALSIMGLLILPAWVDKLHTYGPYFTAGTLAVCAMAFQPVWFFLGIERMKNVTIYMVATKVLYVLLVFVVVHGPKDAFFVIYCWGGAQLLGLVVSIYLVYHEGYGLGMPRLRECLHELRASAQFFWSRLSVALYTSANTVVVGTLGTVAAAHYSVCEQVYKAGQNVAAPINTALFPYMTKNRDWRLFGQLLVAVGGVLIIGCTVVGVFAGPLLRFVFGAEYASSAPVLAIFCAVVVINYYGMTFGYAAFSALDKVHIANISVVVGTMVQVGLVAWLYAAGRMSPLTMALSVLATEGFVMSFRVIFFLRYVRTQRTSATIETV